MKIPFTFSVFVLLLAPAGLGKAIAQTAPVVEIRIDAAADRHPISPNIYGVAFASPEALLDLNCPLNRMGGNATTRYNWELNADNRGSDWYFESLPDASPIPGERGDTFIANAKKAGAEPMLTIPTIGWAARLGPDRGRLSSFSVRKYGAQAATDPYFPDAGNGKAPDGKTDITGNDPTDANEVVTSTFQQNWVRHIVQKWGTADQGGLRYYLLDNEPSIWQGTHRDVHPIGPKMEEIRDRIIDYAAKIRDVDRSAVIVAPEEWGWSGYLYSGFDQQYGGQHGWKDYPDREAHGGMEYLPWLLDQLHKHDAETHQRSLDVFSVHFYPQGGDGGDDVSPKIQMLRNRSTRALWDPAYQDESWIKASVHLIPRLHEWVNRYYPGLKTALTEYNWGAEGHINGATAQADILGILGRERVDLATRWTCPDTKTPTYKAIKLYRNYDGQKSTFGNTGVRTTVPDPDTLSAFAAVRSKDGALTVMVVHKALSGDAAIDLQPTHFVGSGPVQVWQLTSSNRIERKPDVRLTAHGISTTVPAQSITLFVIAPRTRR
jgi:hypothetical protein